jgi:hypothetical protein
LLSVTIGNITGVAPTGNLVANGSFEQNVVTHSQKWNVFAPGTMTGWNIVPATVGVKAEIQRNGVGGWNSSQGSQWLELDGDENGPGRKWDATAMGRPERGLYAIQQPLVVEAGKPYVLMFDFAARPGTKQNQNAMQVRVLDALTDAPGVAIVSERVTALSSQVVAKSAKPQWRMGTIAFVAPSDGNVVLEFRGLGQDAPNYDPATDPLNDTYGMFLDNVAIVPVGADLDVDSNNDGVIDPANGPSGTDDPIEDVAGARGVELPALGRRIEMRLSDVPVGLPALTTLRVDSGAANVRLWDAETGGSQYLLDEDNAVTWPSGEAPRSVWIAAIRPSDAIGDIHFTLSHTLGNHSTPINVKDTVIGTAMAEVMFVYHVDTLSEIDDIGDAFPPPELPSPHTPFGVTGADIAAIAERRAARLALDGNPTVPPDVKTFADLENAVANAEVTLASARSAADRLDAMRAQPASHTKEEYLSTLEQSLFVHDRYVYLVQTARQVQANFLAEQYWVSQAAQTLTDRVNGLPTLVGSLGFDLTDGQWTGLTQSFDGISESLNRMDDNLSRVAGGLKGGLVLLGSGALVATSFAWWPVATAYAGATLFGAGLGYSVGSRLSADQSAFEVVVGSVADNIGVTAISVSLASVDPVTGDEVIVSPEEAGEKLVTGVASLVMLVTMPLANGLPGPTTRIPLPKPTFAHNFGVTAEGAVVAAPAVTWGAAGIDVSQTGMAMASAYVGTTRVVVMMTSGDLPPGSSETPHQETAYRVGEEEGRKYAAEELGLSETDFVNPFGNRGKTADASTGIDDVRIDADGNLWIVEYKGGQGALDGEQMQPRWVEKKIQDLLLSSEPFKSWGARLDAAKAAGKLKGVAIHTEYSRGNVGETSVIGTWDY